MFYEKCGTKNEENARFCEKCGTPLGMALGNYIMLNTARGG